MFSSPKELFDQYWKEKRRKVNIRAAPLSDQWNAVIRILCDEMTASQQLSVSKEKLDQVPNDYLDQMTSEGVLSFNGNRYGFGHESFFDYCFARGFVAKEESLMAFLVKSEQHLFRRTQVKQVLVYLRDADRERYCRELSGLLTDEKIRYHLKDLAVALVVSLPNPNENEWAVLAPWVESQLEALGSGKPNPDRFASLVWNKVFFSQQWFQIVDRKGLVADWLSSENDALVSAGVNYVQSHQRHSGERVAELLEPFVGKGGNWPQRLSQVVQLANLENGRRFFDLFLRLIDDGTLDDARGSAVNGTFWSLLYSLAKARPDWIAEVTAHWLLRRLSIIREIKDATGLNWHKRFNYDDFGPKPISDSAKKAPEEFARYVLPVVLKIADETVFGEEKPAPKYDAVWGRWIMSDSKHPSIRQAYRSAIAVAIEKLAEIRADSIDGILTELRIRDTHMAKLPSCFAPIRLVQYTLPTTRFQNYVTRLGVLNADTLTARTG